MSRWQVEPLPSPPAERSSTRSPLDLVQDRFPNDDLHLDDSGAASPGSSLSSSSRLRPNGMVNFHTRGGRKSAPPTPESSRRSTSSDEDSSAASRRVLIMEAHVQLTTSMQTQDRYVFLFNDLMILAKGKSQNLRLKNRVHVGAMWTATCLDEVSEVVRAPDRSVVMGWPMTNVVATFDTADIKQQFETKLIRLIMAEKSKEIPSSVILKIVKRDPLFSITKCLSVGNRETANDVVHRCLTELHIEHADPAEYQLWVNSSPSEAPYPLIGHEHPYSIHVHYQRRAVARTTSRSPVRCGSETDMRQLKLDANFNDDSCRFVLRQRNSVNRVSLDEFTKLPRKRRRRALPLMRIFKRQMLRSASTSDEHQRLLFGHDLNELCVNDKPCPPIMELLCQLYAVGPFTDGIFRKSASVRKYREVKEKLESGGDVNFDDVSVFVCAAVFKDFLRSLPNCLLTCELYHQWIDATTLTDTSKQIEQMKRLVQQLPSSHLVYLQHVICVLHRIAQHADTNNMTARNLAVCVAQNLLWPPQRTGAAEMLGDCSKVAQVCQQLIESASEIFGSQYLELFPPGAETSRSAEPELDQRLNVSTDDSMALDHADRDHEFGDSDHETEVSSHLGIGGGGALTKHGRQLSQASASHDSGLTLSNDNAPRSLHRSTAVSDDSVLASQEEFSGPENSSEHDAEEDGSLLRRQRAPGAATTPARQRSVQSTASRGIVRAFFNQRSSCDLDAPSQLADDDDFAVEESLPVDHAVHRPDSSNSAAARPNIWNTDAGEQQLTPRSARRHDRGTMTDQDREPFQQRTERTPPRAGNISSQSRPGLVAEADRKTAAAAGFARRRVDSLPETSLQQEAALHEQLLRGNLSEAERRHVNYSLARKIYHRSQMLYASSHKPSPPEQQRSWTRYQPKKSVASKFASSSELQSRSPTTSGVPRRALSPGDRQLQAHSSPKPSVASRAVDKHGGSRLGHLTVTVSPADHRPRHETEPPPPQPMSKSSASGEGKGRLQPQYLAVVDITSSSSSERDNSLGGDWRSRRRAIRKRAQERHRKRLSDPKADGNCSTPSFPVSRSPAGVSTNVGRSRSDASDIVARVSHWTRSSVERSPVPRANESVSLLVTGSPHDRRVIVNSSDAHSVSSDSTFTGSEKAKEHRRAYTMKDREWHRELVNQYQNSRQPITCYRPAQAPAQTAAASRYSGPARSSDNARRATTVVVLPPASPSHTPSKTATNTGRVSASPQARKPTTTTAAATTTTGKWLHSSNHQSGKQDLTRPRGDVANHAGRSGFAESGRRLVSSEKGRREPPRVAPSHAPAAAVSSAAAERRPGRWPTSSVPVESPNTNSSPNRSPRSAAHKPRPAIETRRPPPPAPREGVNDIPNISWSVMKLRERYSGGGGSPSPSTNQTSPTSSAPPIKVDKPESKRIAAVQRLL